MNKTSRILLALGLILALATPALAELKFNGVFNVKAYSEEKKSTTKEEGDSQQFIDQRFRAKVTYSLNDNVSVVYFGEVDTVWGEESKGNIGDGGQVTYRTTGADGVNIETKNVFLDLKFGDTNATLGIQTFGDAFGGLVAFEDMAGLKVTQKMGSANLTALYSKWDEDYSVTNTVDATSTSTTAPVSATAKTRARSDWDDFDFYAVELKNKFSDSFTAGAGVYLMDDNRDNATNVSASQKEVWFYGVNANAKFGDFGLDGMVMLQDGEYDDLTVANVDYDYSGLAASAKGTMKVANGDVGLRVLYFTEDDEADENGAWQGMQGEYGAFVNDNQMQFLVDKFVANDGKEQYAIADAVYGGYGLLGFVLSGNHKLPESMYLNWGAGYYMAADDTTNTAVNGTSAKTEREGDTLGYELAVRIGKVFFEKVDVSLNASYADFGDFYDKTVGGTTTTVAGKTTYVTGDDPDSTYKAYLMVNVPW